MRIKLAIAVFVAAAFVSGCGGSTSVTTSTTEPAGTVAGSLSAVGGPETGDFKPLVGQLTLKATDAAAEVIDSTTANSLGSFVLNAPPGFYSLSAVAGDADCSEQSVLVTRGSVTQVAVACHVK